MTGLMNKKARIIEDFLDNLYPNPKSSLDYNKDYEFLIAVLLSAQTTDRMVNKVTKELFKYNLEEISKLSNEILEDILRPIGTHKKKAEYVKELSSKLLKDYNGKVPNDRAYLESLKGVGRKTANVVLSELFQEPAIAVDTHVARVSKTLGLVKRDDNVLEIEKALEKLFPKTSWGKIHKQLVLFGRYHMKASGSDDIALELKKLVSEMKCTP